MAELNELAVIEKQTLTDIADAIRARGQYSFSMLPSQMADSIANIPDYKPIADMVAGYFNKTGTVFDLARILGYDSPDPAVYPPSGFFKDNKSLVTLYAPMMAAGTEFARFCSSLKNVTIRSLSANKSDSFNGCSSLESLTFTAMTTSQILQSYASFLSGVDEGCTIHCTDNDLEKIDGAWTVVERR